MRTSDTILLTPDVGAKKRDYFSKCELLGWGSGIQLAMGKAFLFQCVCRATRRFHPEVPSIPDARDL